MLTSTIDHALEKIDFQLPDEDLPNFYVYIFSHHYKIDFPYDYEDYRPPKYFKLLYKLVKDHL